MYDMTSMEELVPPKLLEELFSVSTVMSALSAIPGMLVSLATYVAIAYSLYTIASRRGISKPWLAWIPVGNVWIMGSISDHYQLMAKYRTKNKRKLLLFLQILLSILCVLLLIMLIITVVSVLRANADSQFDSFIDVWAPVGDNLLELALLWFVMLAVAIYATVVQYMALYDIYRSCDPGNAVLYLMLSIFISITQPVFMFLCRNKDDGMPKPQPEIPPIAWEPPTAAAETWNTPGQE